ncbi:hypothetical protein BJX99DRAFT_242540 [Aspergillus californicus]
MNNPSKPKHRREFEIAIICALGLESDAVEALFDHYWDGHFEKVSSDPNSYRTGVISNHNVVLAYMPQMGKGPAATVSAHIRSSFENIKIALIVGICGGVPGIGHGSIFLGDVVISESIVNYDHGRRVPDGFVSRDPAWLPDFEVRGFIRKLKGWKGLQDLKKRLGHHHKILQGKTDSHQHPGTHKDRLFDPLYCHKHVTQACLYCNANQPCKEAQDSACDQLGCSPDHHIVRSRPGLTDRSSGTSPQLNIHFGRVASGDTVMRSGQDRDLMALEHDAIAFEMEGAGVYPSLQCVIVKGVCDYADSHKDKLWQCFAAGSAAACMKSILEQWIGRSCFDSQGYLEPTNFKSTPSRQAEIPSENEDNLKPEEGQLLDELHRLYSDFKKTSSTLRECKRYLPRDTDVRRLLKTHRAKFLAGVEAFISQATNSPDEAHNMAADCGYHGWQSEEIADSAYRHLGLSYSFSLKVIKEAQQKLTKIVGLAKRLKNSKEAKGDEVTENTSGLLKASLDDFGSLIRVFSSVIPERARQKIQSESTPPSKAAIREIEHFRIVQQAASSLYDALGKSCSEHSLHNVHLSLQPRLNGTSTQVAFSVSFSGLYAPDSTWIDVESVIKSTESNTEVSSQSYLITEPSTNKRSYAEDSTTQAKRKRVRFRSMPDSILPSVVSPNVPDLFLQQNFCTVVQRQLNEQLPLCNSCIGVLGGSMSCKHLVYISQHAYKEAKSSSLSDLISHSKRNSAKALGLYDRVRLAKYLATAVLYYHTTPWLSGAWRSEDVRFFVKGDGDSDSHILPSPETLPYISCCVRASMGAPNPHPSSSDCDLIVRNPVIFSLGVMLLELAYQAQFNDLKNEIDLAQGSLPFANYFAAKRLAEDVNVHISANFKKIVKKCIDCDFGHDSNFQSSALQDAFHEQVIGGLDEIERKLHRLQLDD